MASCHTIYAAKMFLDAGAQHVIGVDMSKTVSEEVI